MSFSRQQIIETLYRLVTFLATVSLARRLIVSGKYEYDYTVLAPLAMTCRGDKSPITLIE
ncbi:hypothetical protein [Microcoleus sp. OTE_8_concoct_300]|uniref:hypothetical protein n=1 Tax=Microcoleus sp. OTE_8_concoct_300 TaxID=2964710 RepID=UPI00403F7432